VICYKGSNISYQIAKRLIKIKYISLVNLIMNREVVKELIQDEMNEKNLEEELKLLLTDTNKREQLKKDYGELKHLLNEGGDASYNAARIIREMLSLKEATKAF
jgi:lipid-A-disaccharide synthase